MREMVRKNKKREEIFIPPSKALENQSLTGELIHFSGEPDLSRNGTTGYRIDRAC